MKVIFIIFGIFFTLLFFSFSVWFMARKTAMYFSAEKPVFLYLGFGLSVLLMIAGIALFTNTSHAFGNVFYKFSSVLSAVLLYYLLSTVFAEVLRIFTSFKPLAYGILSLSLTVIVLVIGFYSAASIKINELKVYVNNAESETRIAHWTDLHIGHFRSKTFLENITAETLQLKPDMICITGDMFDGVISLNKEVLSPLEKVKIPIYFIEGNHDGYSGSEKIKKFLRKAGVIVLENSLVKNGNIDILGLNYLPPDSSTKEMHALHAHTTIKNELKKAEFRAGSIKVLLHHSPAGINHAADANIDLVLSGHTHGGQLFPFTLFIPFFYQYKKGLYHKGNTTIYVSQGTGTFGPPVRVGTRSEIALIRILPKK